MKEFFIEIVEGKKDSSENEIKGEALLLRAYRRLKKGRYRCQLYSTNKRSLNQNSYVHCVFNLARIALYNGGYKHITTMEAAKWWFKERHLKAEAVNEVTGEVYQFIRRTRDLSKDEMSSFIDTVRDECLEFLGTYIPTPDEYKANYNKYDLVTLAA
jgi:hypothetical protein